MPMHEILIAHLSHPDRQIVELSNQNKFALNTTMSPFSIEYGIQTFEQQYDIILSHRDKVIKELISIGLNDFPSKESFPNFYKPFFCVKKGTWGNHSQEALPYKPLAKIKLKQGFLSDYKVIKALCL